MALTDSLIYSYELDEASGNALDSHGSLTATETNGAIGTGTGIAHATVRDFEADSSQYFTRASQAALQCGDIDASWEVWLKAESIAGDRGIVSKDDGANLEYELFLMSNGYLNFRACNASGSGGLANAYGLTFGPISTGVWYQVIMIHDPAANLLKTRVNNGTIDTYAFSGGIYVGTGAFNIGRNPYTQYFDGLIGPVRYWKRALTSDEQDTLWNGGAGLPYASLGGGGGNPILPSPFVVRSQAVNRASFY